MSATASTWTTRLPHTENYGVTELHGCFFEPIDDRGGMRNAVCIQVPEANRQEVAMGLRAACKMKARFFACCDTMEQVERIARRAAKFLPEHRRIALERAMEAGWGAVRQ
jgi:hypothetical protein